MDFFFAFWEHHCLIFATTDCTGLCQTKLTTISSSLSLVKRKRPRQALGAPYSPRPRAVGAAGVCDWRELLFCSRPPSGSLPALCPSYTIQPLAAQFLGGISVPVGMLLTVFYTEFFRYKIISPSSELPECFALITWLLVFTSICSLNWML